MCSTGVLLVRSFVVLLCLAVVEIHLTPAKVLAAGTGDGLLRVPTIASLANCPSHCGDVEISYPFGIGPRCFRQGFELTCDNTTGSPRLLFLGNNSTQVTSIDVGSNYAYASAVWYNITMGLGVDTYITKSWEAPTEGVTLGRRLYVVGCGVEVYMFGDNATDFLGSCMSICADNREIMEGTNIDGRYYCGEFGCCDISSGRTRQAITLKLGRHNTTIPQLDEYLSSIKVIFSEYYHFVMGDLYASWVNTSNVLDMVLGIAITDQPSCASAQSQENKDTYACNSESICRDLHLSRGGYNCYCTGQIEGNPYVAGGCTQQDYNPKASKENCTRLCGNMIIPFPFGIEEGCFANDNLRLNCTSNATTVLDREYAQYRVISLSLDDGLLTVTNMLNDTSSNNMERVVVTNYDGHYHSFFPTYQEVVDGNFDFSQEDIIIKWAVANLTCQEAKRNNDTYACISDNSFCEEVMRGKTHDGYRCKCSDGFQGNPYLQNNCTDPTRRLLCPSSPTPSTREPPPPVGGGHARLAKHLQAQGDGPPLPVPHAPTPLPLLSSTLSTRELPAQVGGAAATMGVGHRRASYRRHHGSWPSRSGERGGRDESMPHHLQGRASFVAPTMSTSTVLSTASGQVCKAIICLEIAASK